MDALPGRNGVWRRGSCWLVALVSGLLLVVGCTGTASDSRPTPEASSPADTIARDYWPTTGWRTAKPEDHGINPAQLAMVEDLLSTGYPHVRSVLVVRHGYLVYEQYRHGLDRTSGHDVRSITKSVVGALVGVALAEGKITSVEQTVGELLPAHLPESADSRFANVTVRQLLTMTSGLPGDDESMGGDPRAYDATWASSDWVRHILGQRLVTEPGTRFAYNDATAHLLSAIVANASGESTLAYARDKLFDPLGIRTQNAFEPVLDQSIVSGTHEAYERSSVAWPTDPQGVHFGGSSLRLPARDLAKFGYLYLNGGRWDGQQVVPADYVAAATSAKGSSPNVSAGYGWLWWVGSEGGRTFVAQGRGGQLIYVVPESDLVIVVTSDPEAGGPDPKILINQIIVPAVTR